MFRGTSGSPFYFSPFTISSNSFNSSSEICSSLTKKLTSDFIDPPKKLSFTSSMANLRYSSFVIKGRKKSVFPSPSRFSADTKPF